MTRYLVNPLFLYLAVWASVVVLYVAGVAAQMFPPPAPQIYWAVALNVATFSLGYMTWSLLGYGRPEDDLLEAPADAPLTAVVLKRYLNVTLFFGLLAVGLCAARVVILAKTYKIDLPYLVANPYLWRKTLTSAIAPDMVGMRLCTIGITLACSVFSIGFVLLGILLYFGRSRRRYVTVVLFLLTSLTIGLLSLARKEVTINVLFVVLSYLLMHRLYRTRRPREVAWHLIAPAAALAVLFVLIDVLLQKGANYDPENRLMGFLFSIYWYIASPLAAFGEFLKSYDHDWRLGQSLFFPLYKWLVRAHLVQPSDTTSIIQMEKIYIPYMTNVYTYLRNIYEDFGFFGLAIVPYVLGVVAAGLRRRAGQLVPYLNLYMIVLIIVIFSFYNHLLVSNQFYLQAFFGFVLFRARLTGLDRLSSSL